MLGCCQASALADNVATKRSQFAAPPPVVPAEVETVRFADPRLPAVRVVRGMPAGAPPPPAPAAPAVPQFQKTPKNTEIVSFGDGTGRTVAVVRGSGFDGAEGTRVPLAGPVSRMRVETMRFSDPLVSTVSVVRGESAADLGLALFGSADDGELNRVAFAIDGVESGHGSNLAMWKYDLGGPQGPMQISAAAALDVGGGNRFDMRENRMLGRAYVALLYRRYGNWPDAIAAYNWGPGNFDAWVAAGRPMERLPLETARYLSRVLRDAFFL